AGEEVVRRVGGEEDGPCALLLEPAHRGGDEGATDPAAAGAGNGEEVGDPSAVRFEVRAVGGDAAADGVGGSDDLAVTFGDEEPRSIEVAVEQDEVPETLVGDAVPGGGGGPGRGDC